MKKIENSLGKIIKEYRVSAAMTQLELAKKLGYEIPQFISLIENGHSKVPLNILGQIMTFLDIPEKVLLTALIENYESDAREQLYAGKKRALSTK